MLWLLEQELLRSIRQITRYPVDHIVGFVVGVVFFVSLFVGLRLAAASGSPLIETNLDVLTLSYFFWLLTISCITGVSSDLSGDMATGAIDVLMESRVGLIAVTAVRALTGLVVSAAMSLLLLIAAVLVVGSPPAFGATLTMPAIAIVLQAFALGLLAGALVLLLKRVKVLLTLLTFVLLPAFLLPLSRQGAASTADWWLPVVMLKRRAAGAAWDATADFATVGIALALLGVAFAVFSVSASKVMRSGSARNV